MSTDSADARRQKILSIVFLALLVIAGWRFAVPAFMGWVDSLTATQEAQRRAARTASITSQEIQRVRIEDLQREAATYNPNRNIFRFTPPRAAPPPPRAAPPPPR